MKARAVFLAAVVVLSMVGGSIAFAGSAAAANAEGLSGGTATDVVVGGSDVTQDVTFEINPANNDNSTVTLNTSDLSVDVTGVSATPDGDVTLDDANGATLRSNGNVTLNVTEGGSEGDLEQVTVTLTYADTSAASAGSDNIGISAEGITDPVVGSFNFIDDPIVKEPNALDISSEDTTFTVENVTINPGDQSVSEVTAYFNATVLENYGVDTDSLSAPSDSNVTVNSGGVTYSSSESSKSSNGGVTVVYLNFENVDGQFNVSFTSGGDIDASQATSADGLTYDYNLSYGSSTDSSFDSSSGNAPGADDYQTDTFSLAFGESAPTLVEAITGDSLTGNSDARNKLYVDYDNGPQLNASSVEIADYDVNGNSETITNVALAQNGEDVILTIDRQLPTDAIPSVTQTGAIEDAQGNELTGGPSDPDATDGLNPNVTDYTVTNPSGQDVHVQFNSSESLSTITANVTGAEDVDLTESDFSTEQASAPYTYTATHAGTTDGEYTVTLETANDTADNNGATGQTESVTVDTTDPTDLSIDKPTAQVVNTTDDTLLVNYSYTEANPDTATIILENGSNVVEYNVDDSEYSGGEKQVALDLNASSADAVEGDGFVDGTYNLTVNVTDVVGNTTSTTTNDLVDMDLTDPVVDITSPTEFQYNRTGQTLTVESDITEEHPDHVNVTLADGTGNNVTYANIGTDGDSDLTLTNDAADVVNGDGLTNATYDVTVTAVDVVGQTGADTETDIVEIDDIAPGDIQIERPTSQVERTSGDTLDVAYNYYENNTESVSITLNGAADYTYSVDDSQYVNDNTRKSLAIDLDQPDAGDQTLDDGAYSVKVTVTDSAGNDHVAETTEQYVVINDKSSDVNDVDDISDVVRPGDNVTVTYDYEDQVNATSVTFELVDDKNDADSDNDEVVETLGTSSDVESANDIDKELTIPDGYDGDQYYIRVTAENDLSDGPTSDKTSTFDINEELPEITKVETDAGTNTATVHFNEDVYATGDETFTADDFAYQDASAEGAIGIDTVSGANGSTTVDLTLNGAVQASDLQTDLINARQGQIEDSAGAQVGTEAVALNDTTGPSVEIVDLDPVDSTNADDYSGVSIDTDETVNVTVYATSNDSINATYSDIGPSDNVQLTDSSLNLSSLDDTENLDLTVEVEDLSEAGYTADDTESVEKDTVNPYVVSATTNAGTSEIAVTFNEPVTGAEVEATNISTGSTDSVGDEPSSVWTVSTMETVQPADIDNASVQASAASATDDVNNAANSSIAVNLTDVEAPEFIGDADTSNGSTTVDVAFTEQIYNASGENLTAANFTYVNNTGQSNAVTAVDYDEATQTATLTLENNVSAADLSSDLITSDAVDSEGQEVANSAVLYTGLTVEVTDLSNPSDRVVQMNLTADEEIDSFEGDLDSQISTTDELADVNFDESDFTLTLVESANGEFDYTATATVPRDGQYDLDVDEATAVGGATDDDIIYYVDDRVDVDAQDPSVIDAEITDYDGDETTISVQADEPIRPSDAALEAADNDDNTLVNDVLPAATSIEGVDNERINSIYPTSGNEFSVQVDGAVETGDEPQVTVDSTAMVEFSNDTSTLDANSTTVNTIELELSEGTNFVSVPAQTDTVSTDDLNLSNVEVIWTHDNGQWTSFEPDEGSMMLEGGQGYIFQMSQADELDVNAYNTFDSPSRTAPTQQTLDEGWNLVGHYEEGQQYTPEALSSVGIDNVHLVLEQSGSDYSYSAQPGTLQPGEAYWVFIQTNEEGYTTAPLTDFEEEPPQVLEE